MSIVVTSFSFFLIFSSSRFHPLVKTTGTILIKGQPIDAAGDAMFVHAIQGLMPNKVSLNVFLPAKQNSRFTF